MKLSILAAAALSVLPALAIPQSPCPALDQFYGEYTGSPGGSCLWWVCGAHGQWRLVRDCPGSRCHANPTTCVDKLGQPW